MMKTFYIRTMTAILFVIVMLGGMLWNAFSFCILFLIIAVLGLWEYFQIMEKIHPGYAKSSAYQRLIATLLLPAGFLIASGEAFSFLGQSAMFLGWQLFLLLFFLLLVLAGFQKTTRPAFKNLGYSLLGVLYTGLPLSLLVALMWQFPKQEIPVLPLAIIFSLWINDTLAYISGSLVGKTPFAPKISPKKTWEGTLGGILLTLIAAAVFGYYSTRYSIGTWIAIAGVTAVTGTVGDLLESLLKRKAGIKDSGKLLPGHGGILDRFDSLLLATPFVWLLMQALS